MKENLNKSMDHFSSHENKTIAPSSVSKKRKIVHDFGNLESKMKKINKPDGFSNSSMKNAKTIPYSENRKNV